MSEVKVNKITPRTDCGTVTVGDSGDSVSVTAGVPVTVNGDLKSNALKATDGGVIISQSGTTITVGASGDTVSLASGASQSGFGRSGTVDWQTSSIKTSTFTAVSGQGFFADTSSSAFTMNLPAGTAGAIVSVADYTNTFQTNNLTITPNGSQKIGGVAASSILSTEGQSVTLVYVDDTEGWKNVQDSTSNLSGNPYMIATGGTETTSGNCKIHTFTGPGTFTVSQTAVCSADNVVSHMVIAGGGGGGSGGGPGGGSGAAGAGGGAGGYREVISPSSPYSGSSLNGYPSAPNRVTVTATAFPITVGAGGSATTPGNNSNEGSNSVFSTITSAGGGGGGSRCAPNQNGKNGGSGGGGAGQQPGGTGNTPPVTPAQGNNGGNSSGPNTAGGGGGGADSAGAAPVNPGSGGGLGAPGGNGTTSSINASPTTRAGGGGGGGGGDAPSGHDNAGGSGGPGGGGGGGSTGNIGSAGSTNTGSGGGGGGSNPGKNGSAGGSGIVIIRYRFQ